MSWELKKDKYFRAREGFGKFLDVFCANCGSKVLVYQKDGRGKLLRCYLNRIVWPEIYSALQGDAAIQNPSDMPKLTCPSCEVVIGAPMRHEDKRLAFRLIYGRFSKKNHEL